MSALLITLLRFGFLALLWIFVLVVILTIRHDVFGTQVRPRSATAKKRKRKKYQKPTNAKVQASAPPQPHNFSLVVVQGQLAGTRLHISSAPLMIGRSPDSALVLDDGYASSRHARIYCEGDRVILEDLNSTNGTWLGSVQIHEPTVVPAGAQITIGKTVLEVHE